MGDLQYGGNYPLRVQLSLLKGLFGFCLVIDWKNFLAETGRETQQQTVRVQCNNGYTSDVGFTLCVRHKGHLGIRSVSPLNNDTTPFSEVLVGVKFQACWDIMPCPPVNINPHFKGSYSNLPQGQKKDFRIKAIEFPETLAPVTSNYPGLLNSQESRCKNFESCNSERD